MAATSWEFATPISELAARVRHRLAGGHAHDPGTTDFEMLRHLCRAVITSPLRLRDRRASELQVFTIDDESEDGEARDLLIRRHPSTQTILTRVRLNLGHPKSNVLIRPPSTCSRCVPTDTESTLSAVHAMLRSALKSPANRPRLRFSFHLKSIVMEV